MRFKDVSLGMILRLKINMKREDLTGQKFSKYTVLEFDSIRNGRTYWLCLCDCGNKKVADGGNLKSGHTKSCGCHRIQLGKDKLENLIGQRFGKIFVKDWCDIKNKKNRWLCICDCGKETVVYGHHLKEGVTNSCGCLKGCEPENLSNMTFGLLETKEYLGESKWLCVCECGNTTITTARNLKDEKTRSCGCLTRRTGKDNPKWRGCEDICQSFISNVRGNAMSRNLVFNITIDDILSKFNAQSKKCALSGQELVFAKNKKEQNTGITTASVDRINSSVGYEINNVWLVHKYINKIKGSLSVSDLLYWCD